MDNFIYEGWQETTAVKDNVLAYSWHCTTFSYYLVLHMHATMNKILNTGVTPHPSVPRLKKVYSHTTTTPLGLHSLF
jgi:hypothetical protein